MWSYLTELNGLSYAKITKALDTLIIYLRDTLFLPCLHRYNVLDCIKLNNTTVIYGAPIVI